MIFARRGKDRPETDRFSNYREEDRGGGAAFDLEKAEFGREGRNKCTVAFLEGRRREEEKLFSDLPPPPPPLVRSEGEKEKGESARGKEGEKRGTKITWESPDVRKKEEEGNEGRRAEV